MIFPLPSVVLFVQLFWREAVRTPIIHTYWEGKRGNAEKGEKAESGGTAKLVREGGDQQ